MYLTWGPRQLFSQSGRDAQRSDPAGWVRAGDPAHRGSLLPGGGTAERAPECHAPSLSLTNSDAQSQSSVKVPRTTGCLQQPQLPLLWTVLLRITFYENPATGGFPRQCFHCPRCLLYWNFLTQDTSPGNFHAPVKTAPAPSPSDGSQPAASPLVLMELCVCSENPSRTRNQPTEASLAHDLGGRRNGSSQGVLAFPNLWTGEVRLRRAPRGRAPPGGPSGVLSEGGRTECCPGAGSGCRVPWVRPRAPGGRERPPAAPTVPLCVPPCPEVSLSMAEPRASDPPQPPGRESGPAPVVPAAV